MNLGYIVEAEITRLSEVCMWVTEERVKGEIAEKSWLAIHWRINLTTRLFCDCAVTGNEKKGKENINNLIDLIAGCTTGIMRV